MLSTLNAGDTAWMLLCSALVFLMVPGLSFFLGGLGPEKNTLSILKQGFMAVCLVSLQWILFGYSLSFGPDHNGWIGTLAWAGLHGVSTEPNLEYAGTVPQMGFVLYQAMIASIAILILLGTFAHRIKFSAFCVFALLWTTLVYDPVAHWVWGVGGFLRNSGVVDFAGGTVVHLSAGVSALALALVLGSVHHAAPADTSSSSSTSSLSILGAALLWFAWFGFNGGHALSAGVLAANACAATHAAAVTAAVVWTTFDRVFYKQTSLMGLLTGAIVGLVAITPAAGTVGPAESIGIGLAATVLVYAAFVLCEKWLRYGPALLPLCVFGLGGICGTLCSGPFRLQLKGILAISIYSFVMSYLLLKAMDYIMGLSTATENT
jgi:Amt family ammonium transporter